jgi:hypothetical protein
MKENETGCNLSSVRIANSNKVPFIELVVRCAGIDKLRQRLPTLNAWIAAAARSKDDERRRNPKRSALSQT